MQWYEIAVTFDGLKYLSNPEDGQWAKREDVELLKAHFDRAIKELANIDGENYCPERDCGDDCEKCWRDHIMEGK
jgi:hypothetical protein